MSVVARVVSLIFITCIHLQSYAQLTTANNPTVHIPVFGDIHGNLRGLLSTVQRLQEIHEEVFPFVLQLGDFGYFPDFKSNTQVSKRELNNKNAQGVATYLAQPERFSDFFDASHRLKRVVAKIIFVRGNHEDQTRLHEFSSTHVDALVPIDSNRRLFFLQDGRIAFLRIEHGLEIKIAGYGGIDWTARPHAYERNPGIAFKESCEAALLSDALNSGERIDVLLTHQGTRRNIKGSEHIELLIELVKPRIHLHGHSHQAMGPISLGEGIESFTLGRLPNVNRPPLDENFFGFLKLSRISGELKFSFEY